MNFRQFYISDKLVLDLPVQKVRLRALILPFLVPYQSIAHQFTKLGVERRERASTKRVRSNREVCTLGSLFTLSREREEKMEEEAANLRHWGAK